MCQLFCKGDGAEYAERADKHDGAGEDYAEHNVEDTFLEVHVQEARGEGSGPCAGPREGNPDKEQKGDVKSPSGLRFKFASALLAFLQTPAEELAGQGFILPPFQDLPGEKKDEGDREHVPDDGYKERRKERQIESDCVRDGPPEFYERDH